MRSSRLAPSSGPSDRTGSRRRRAGGRALVALVCVLPIVPFTTLEAVEIAPNDCGRCHVNQFKRWVGSVHRRDEVDCNSCHGEFHSASIQGCRASDCHPGKHDRLFREWAEIQLLDAPNSEDYVCSVCHDPHRGGLKWNKEGCKACHNEAAHARTVELHTGLLEEMFPTENDGFALLAASSRPLPRLVSIHDDRTGSRMKQLGGVLLKGAELVAVFFAATLLLFPLTLAVLLASGKRGGKSVAGRAFEPGARE